MKRKGFLINLNEDLYRNFRDNVEKDGFKKTNEALELVLQLVVDGKISLKKELKQIVTCGIK